MRVVIQDDYEKMSLWAAHYIADKINNHKEDRPFILGLPTGSSPIGVYQELVRMNKAGDSGAKTVFDVAPALLSPLSGEEIRAHML